MSQTAAINTLDRHDFKPRHGYFVGLDSDGCVFDTMETKQKQCFHPAMIDQWKLHAIAFQVRRAAEFVNLYSRWRGQNRYLNLLRVMDLLRAWPEASRNAAVPALNTLRGLAASGCNLNRSALFRVIHGGGDLQAVLEWSDRVDDMIAGMPPASPFDGAARSLELMAGQADIVIISQTPIAALSREWQQAGLAYFIRAVAGQETGSKTEQLAMAIDGRYAPDHVLVIGDAPGDALAASAKGALFYPIAPARETSSWEFFLREGFIRFVHGHFAGSYADNLLREFNALLPVKPSWQSTPATGDHHDLKIVK